MGLSPDVELGQTCPRPPSQGEELRSGASTPNTRVLPAPGEEANWQAEVGYPPGPGHEQVKWIKYIKGVWRH